jgi:putative transposase
LDLFFLRFRSAVARLVAPLFSFKMKEGAWYRKRDLIELGLHMAVMNGYAEGVASSLRCHGDTPTGETLLDYVKSVTREEMLVNAEVQIDCCVKQLKMKGLRFKNLALAFDWHDESYYGKPVPGMVGTQPKRGTCYAFSFITASILTPGRRLVLCIVPLSSRMGLSELVLELLGRIRRHVKGVKYVAFDNGFQSSELILELQKRRISFIMPLRDTVKLKRRRRWMRYAKHFTYTMEGVTVDVVEAQDAEGRTYFLATNMAASPKRILRLFKLRWGIETSYRKIREFLPKTTSRIWAVRIFNFIFACLLYNTWVVLNAKTRTPTITIALKLNYIWSFLILHLTQTEDPSG